MASKRMNLYFHDVFYNLLIEKIGKRKVSHYIESTLTPIILERQESLEEGYKRMGKDEKQMQDAVNMANACMDVVTHEAW